MGKAHRQRFFDKMVKIEGWRKSMAGKNEDCVMKVFESLGYEENKDYVRQYPIGEMFVLDFAFVNERVAIEVDGTSHNCKKQKTKDNKRDTYLRVNDWVCLRIKDKEMFGYKQSFYKNLIKEIVEERRKQWEVGRLYEIEIPNYVEYE